MRLEQIPVVLGILVAVIGLGFIVDAVLPEQTRVFRERRRRPRTERHRTGEAMVGLGTIGMAIALIGGDTSYFGTVAVIAGALLVAAGAWLNRDYLGELISFRGPARRADAAGAADPRAGIPTSARTATAAPTPGRPHPAGSAHGIVADAHTVPPTAPAPLADVADRADLADRSDRPDRLERPASRPSAYPEGRDGGIDASPRTEGPPRRSAPAPRPAAGPAPGASPEGAGPRYGPYPAWPRRSEPRRPAMGDEPLGGDPRRDAAARRGDRERPIPTTRDHRSGDGRDDGAGDGPPRMRIR